VIAVGLGFCVLGLLAQLVLRRKAKFKEELDAD
jgi:hypothetical protein